MRKLMNAYFYKSLKGDQIILKIPYIPTHQTPVRLSIRHWKCTWVAIRTRPIQLITDIHKYTIVYIRMSTIYNFPGNNIGITHHVISIDSIGNIKTQIGLIVYLDSLLPKQLYDIHYIDY